METKEKALALAQNLYVAPNKIVNDYGNYYTVNPRTVKQGHSPSRIERTVKDFKTLVGKDLKAEIDVCILNSDENTARQLYQKIELYLQPIAEKARKVDGRKPLRRSKLDIYNELKAENIHVVNIPYYLLLDDGQYHEDYIENIRKAWFNRSVKDLRQDVQINDGEYLVVTDDEANKLWDESLENYLNDCVYPELPDNMSSYFDDEKWKRDARMDGRAHALSSYDGNEEEETINGTTYYIYRTN